ncbi:putative leucine-rich repeat-containing, plant-type, leucine-rich repeat domain superfamily [Helianthus annuus]|uniref:Leucine-rich repeat-containing, plant-type, leucine-rich repeat domain superfamily n=1 Tax=Helianthus annuus TaxID=4232 RepID=A0A251SV16_HELAN|nr:putative leucine-rich repeat-containing, plant-type, leucine-rich repeat domain superfamily [Helianthus annuus]KAJ0477401.1 putative leucine-rich repeat-containing, plant-type, leucine-rich repeat domain superfamily [Helianthus annuus]KAJ0481860.1 putative leucine-rich repeat-containing, plant-type, leucine-rich repeat domain superfamily [Helianthus annuus]KAJ0498238.1 putative leucine-rich repeat-containing, plant-type, leucine-rich repeat domain superfamily [Helianthus annuus]KAJ0664241.1 
MSAALKFGLIYDARLCLDDERQALLQFKRGLVDEANRLASWAGETSDCCKWIGILCDNITGNVHKIHLPGKCLFDDYNTIKEYDETVKRRLRGVISPSILYLKQLEHLDLSCNDFRGIQIPRFIGSLGNLRYLNLSRSKFGRTIPPQLGNLTKLGILCLGSFYDDETGEYERTSIMNMQWLSSLHSLHHLDMSGVDLAKATDWFQVINTLPSLAQLHFSNCQLPDIHSYIGSVNLTVLSLLDLSRNEFNTSFIPQWIFRVTNLVSLDLSMCGLHGPIPSSISIFQNFTSLKFLHISGNEFMSSSLVLKELSSTGGNLISLDMGSCGVKSATLDSLHNLTSLRSLDLHDNQLTSTIPKSLGNLCNLRHINMRRLSGFLPNELGHLINLVHLQLGYNHIAGPIPESIGRLSFLRSLDLNENLISGPIPYSIGGLLSLEELYLSNSQLTDVLPESMGQLSKLNTLDFSHNLLTGVVTDSHFSKLTELKYLNGRGNTLALRPRQANWVPSFQLETLYISSWDLGPQFPLWLLMQRNLSLLEMRNTNISSTMPESFWRTFPNLEFLDMSQNQIQGRLFEIPVTLSVGHYIIFCRKRAEALILANNHLSGVIPECWVKWPNLSFLNLENNNLSGVIPTTLGSLTFLQSLNMCKNKLSGRLPASLKNLTSLQILQLATNRLVGSIPAWIGTELSNLRILNLRSNNFDGNITHEICYLAALQILDFARNNLSGNIPRCFNNFSVLSKNKTPEFGQLLFLEFEYIDIAGSASLVVKGQEYTYNTILGLVMVLDLSSNKLSGSIPVELMALQALQSLNISRNQLTGVIPKNIGDLKLLESFDASLNHLSGELPMSFSGLSFLSSFNVSFNNLTGRVPSSTQLQSFNESSFIGNKLCGVPLTKLCGEVVHNNDQQEGDTSHGVDFGLIISVLLGFFVGFCSIVVPLNVGTIWILLSKLRNMLSC